MLAGRPFGTAAPPRFRLPHLLRQSSETLAGRAYVNLTPFTLQEAGADQLRHHWLRGGFPLSFLANDDAASHRWRQQFVRTFLDRDIPALGIDLTRGAPDRLWTLVASASGTLLNKAKLADPVGVSAQTITRYLDLLEATFMVRQPGPLFANVKKRLVRRPQIT